MDPTSDQMEVLRTGAEFRNLLQTAGYKRLLSVIGHRTNELLTKLQQSKELNPIETARLVDQWRAHEDVYSWIVTVTEDSIEQAKALVLDLERQGVQIDVSFL